MYPNKEIRKHEPSAVAQSSFECEVKNVYINRLLFAYSNNITINNITVEHITKKGTGNVLVNNLAGSFFQFRSDSDSGDIETADNYKAFDVDLGSKQTTADDYFKVTVVYTCATAIANQYIRVLSIVDEEEPEFLLKYSSYKEQEMSLVAVEELWYFDTDELAVSTTESIELDTPTDKLLIPINAYFHSAMLYGQYEGVDSSDIEAVKMYENLLDIPGSISFKLTNPRTVIVIQRIQDPISTARSIIELEEKNVQNELKASKQSPELVQSAQILSGEAL